MTKSHTPGPWIIKEGTFCIYIVSETVDKEICKIEVDAGAKNLTEIEANASLIAAAPELLEALEKVRDFGLDDFAPGEQELYKLMDNVIAKARGETK